MVNRKFYKYVPYSFVLYFLVGTISADQEAYEWMQLANGLAGVTGILLAISAFIAAKPAWHAVAWGALGVLFIYFLLALEPSIVFWEIVAAVADA